MALFISEQVAAVTAYNAGNPQFTVYYGENAAEAARQALLAQGYAVDAATSAAYAGGFQTPEYATRAAGEAATTVGQVFRVPLNTSPQTFAWYRRAAIDSEEVSPIGAVDSGYLVKGNGLTTPVSASIIYDSGTNIGIGTSSPTSKFDVFAASGYVDLRVRSNTTQAYMAADTAAITVGTYSNVPMLLTTNNTERMRIDSSGNVGIGTSNPGAKLDVSGVAVASTDASTGNSPLVAANINSGSNTTKYTSLLFQGRDTVNSGKNVGLVQCGPSDINWVSSYLAFQTRESDALTERLRIDSSGNVGINESAPDYKLDVNGTFGFTPGSSVTPVDNGDVVFELTNNTTLTIKAKGSDGVVRSATITLA